MIPVMTRIAVITPQHWLLGFALIAFAILAGSLPRRDISDPSGGRKP